MSNHDPSSPRATDPPVGGFVEAPNGGLWDGWRGPALDDAGARTIVVENDAPSEGRAVATPADVRYRLARVGPLSVLRLSLIFSAGLLLIVLAAVTVLYFFLDGIGVLRSIQHAVNHYSITVHRFRFDLGWILVRVAWVGLAMGVAGSLVVTCLAVFYNGVADLGGGLDLSLEAVERSSRVPGPPGTRGQRSDGRRWGRSRSTRPLRVGMLRDGRGDGFPNAAGF